MKNESEEGLLIYMSFKEDNPEEASLALGEFYGRHREFLYSILKRVYKNALRQEVIEDLVDDTFIQGFVKAHLCDFYGETDPDKQRKMVRGWLGGIAKNIFLQDKRKEGRIEIVYNSDLVDDIEYQEDSAIDPLIEEMMDLLNEKERAVLITSYQFYDPVKKNIYTPTEELHALAAYFDLTLPAIRKIRQRAIEKILKHFEPILSA